MKKVYLILLMLSVSFPLLKAAEAPREWEECADGSAAEIDPAGYELIQEARVGNHEAVHRFLTAPGVDLNAQDRFGDTALMYAVRNGDNALIKTLIKAGANPLQQNHNGETACTMASPELALTIPELAIPTSDLDIAHFIALAEASEIELLFSKESDAQGSAKRTAPEASTALDISEFLRPLKKAHTETAENSQAATPFDLPTRQLTVKEQRAAAQAERAAAKAWKSAEKALEQATQVRAEAYNSSQKVTLWQTAADAWLVAAQTAQTPQAFQLASAKQEGAQKAVEKWQDIQTEQEILKQKAIDKEWEVKKEPGFSLLIKAQQNATHALEIAQTTQTTDTQQNLKLSLEQLSEIQSSVVPRLDALRKSIAERHERILPWQTVDEIQATNAKIVTARAAEFFVETLALDAHQLGQLFISAQHDPHKRDFLLAQGAPVDAQNEAGNTPLLSVFKADSVKLLLQAGANPDIPNHLGQTPLMKAVAAENPESIRLLVAAGAHVNAKNKNDDTVLMLAVRRKPQNKALLLVQEILAGHPDLALTNTKNKTAHQTALQNKNNQIARMLVEYSNQKAAAVLYAFKQANQQAQSAQSSPRPISTLPLEIIRVIINVAKEL